MSVVGAKGGSGATTIACTLAAELHQQTGKKFSSRISTRAVA